MVISIVDKVWENGSECKIRNAVRIAVLVVLSVIPIDDAIYVGK
ncbi:MAG: hypothetical protein WAM27_02575 [Nitrososphaeraceae archaeon]